MNDESLQDLMIKEIRQRPRNNESFQRIISEYYKWNVSEMEINGFLSADSMEESTTWGEVQYSEINKSYFKYPEMVQDAYSSFEKINSGLKWRIDKKEINIT
jgi:hypothetical protein